MKLTLPEWLKLIKGDFNDSEPVDLLLAEPIGFDPKTYTGVSSNAFGQTLAGIPKAKTVNLLINCLGGSIPEGMAMHNMIMARGNVNTCVIGYAASMGAVIFQAGVKRQMMPGTMLAIHPAQGSPSGSADEIEEQVEGLRKVNDTIVALFSNRTKLSKKKVSDMMDAVTYMDPDEALENGFCDEVIESSPAWNDLAKFRPSDMKNFRQLTNSMKVGGGGETTNNNKQKTMKSLTAALAAVGLLPSAELTDEAAIVSAFQNKFPTFSKAVEENTALKTRIEGYENAQKLRVTAAVELAVTNKLVKPERKDSLIAIGIRDEAELTNQLADLTGLKNEQPARRPGAAPVPPEKKGNEGTASVDEQVETLRNSLHEATPAQKTVISRQIRELRGHKNLFTPVAK